MRVIILGSAAGGGVPQWNCGCRNCTEARHTNRSRTQSSVAVSADGERWILLNTSPDLRTQLAARAGARRPRRYARRAPTEAFAGGLRLRDGQAGGTLAYSPTAGAMDEAVRRAAGGADLVFFDGTFWSDDELRAAGVAAPTAREMGHLPVGGPGGSLELLPQLAAKRVVLVHFNNTNPILCRSSAERARVEPAGIVVCADAVEFEL